jgi:2-keto-4-pentenoate hydratase
MMDVGPLADRIWEAVVSGEATTPLTEDHPDLTVDAAYEIQDAVLARYREAGDPVTALKLGLTSRAKQQQMNVTEPLYGWLTGSMALDVGQPLVVSELIQPRAEPEIAFILGEDLAGSAVTAADVVAATAAAAPAIDILDSRFTGYRFTLADVAADNSSAARYLIGPTLTPPAGVDLRLVGCVFSKNGELVGTAAGAATLGDPAAAVAWAVRKLAKRGGGLRAGQAVLSGALVAAVPISPGDHVLLELDRLGSLQLRGA